MEVVMDLLLNVLLGASLLFRVALCFFLCSAVRFLWLFGREWVPELAGKLLFFRLPRMGVALLALMCGLVWVV